MVELSFVIPCRDEGAGLIELHRRISAAARDCTDSFEIVLVDDGSADETWQVMQKLVAERPEIVAAKLSRGFGQQAALAAGLSLARGNRVLTLDADLQDPPELLSGLLALMNAGADIVHARRRSRRGESLLKRATAALFYRLINGLSDTPVERDCGEFRLYSRRTVDALSSLHERHRLLRGLAGWVGFPQAVLEYDRPPRAEGRSKFPLPAMVRLATDAFTGFSIRPLRLATLFAALCSLTAVGFAAYGAASWALGTVPSGWPFALALLSFYSALQLLSIGIAGEYLGRLYEQSLGRPLFIVEEVVRGGSAACETRPAVRCPTESAADAQAVSQGRRSSAASR